jgi:hypothetical protein
MRYFLMLPSSWFQKETILTIFVLDGTFDLVLSLVFKQN